MYAPRAFKVEDAGAAFDLIARYGFATLVTVDCGKAVVSQLPMLADRERRVLRGHLARANPHSALVGGRTHLVVFSGADAYVSPDWYADAREVPTWNYSITHAEGPARVLETPADVDALLVELSDWHEARRHDLADGKIWKLSKLPAEKLEKLRLAIVAFEISIEKLDYKAKLSQNRDARDFQTVVDKLSRGDEKQRAVADAMREAERRKR